MSFLQGIQNKIQKRKLESLSEASNSTLFTIVCLFDYLIYLPTYPQVHKHAMTTPSTTHSRQSTFPSH